MEFFGVILGTFEVFFIFGMFYYGVYGIVKASIDHITRIVEVRKFGQDSDGLDKGNRTQVWH